VLALLQQYRRRREEPGNRNPYHPFVKRASIRNPASGTNFMIVAANNSSENMYIQSAELNWKKAEKIKRS
jgi:putative alpha-1,2-mannosidase